MSLKEDVNKLLVKFGLTESDVIETKDEAKEEVKKEFDREKFEDVALLDGTIIMVEPALEEGAKVVAMDGEIPVPLPVEEYELSDGRILVVTKAGVIAKIKEATNEEEVIEELDKEAAPEVSEKQKEAKRVIESIVTEKVFALEEKFKKQIEDLTTALSEEKKERVEFSKESLELISKIGNEPKEEPKQNKRLDFSNKRKH